jgi:rhodanese-related sulfurtransferase
VLTPTAPPTLEFADALAYRDEGAAFVDLRPTDAYLEVHIPGSLALVYEFGPGMAARARDCLPLDLPLVVLAAGGVDIANAAAALRGKGFTVLGAVENAVNAWISAERAIASTEVATGSSRPAGAVLDVGDPGAARIEGSKRIVIERLWTHVDEVGRDGPIVVVAGFGVRAGLAVGILERAGRNDIVFWKTRA